MAEVQDLNALIKHQSDQIEKQREGMKIQHKQFLDLLQSGFYRQTTVAATPVPSFAPFDSTMNGVKITRQGSKSFQALIRSPMILRHRFSPPINRHRFTSNFPF